MKLEPRLFGEQIEEGHELAPKFGADGLLRCITAAARPRELPFGLSQLLLPRRRS